MRAAAALGLLILAGCPARHAGPVGPTPPDDEDDVTAAAPDPEAWRRRRPMKYLKGQTHLHTGNSGDCAAPPDEVVRWYDSWGFDFIVVTDHDFISQLPSPSEMLVLPGVELTQNSLTCDPPPIPGKKCNLHMNALFVSAPAPAEVPWVREPQTARLDIYQRALDTANALGGIAQLNHPNFHWAADGPLATELARRGVVLMEIANQAMPISNPGDATHPSVEALWDEVLTAGVTVWGVATDDTHHYDDAAMVRAVPHVYMGNRGWVMVRAERDEKAIREAMLRGEFYATTGVLLDRVEVVDGVLEVDLKGDRFGRHEVVFIGAGGRELARQETRRGRYRLADAGAEGYVRAVVADAYGRKAWVQPVRFVAD